MPISFPLRKENLCGDLCEFGPEPESFYKLLETRQERKGGRRRRGQVEDKDGRGLNPYRKRKHRRKGNLHVYKKKFWSSSQKESKRKRKFQSWGASRAVVINIGHTLLIILIPKFFLTPREAERTRVEEEMRRMRSSRHPKVEASRSRGKTWSVTFLILFLVLSY